ncbi:MAG: SGNH/GDSL hydrolase family protein, partial [Rubripirellula sp.]
MSENQEKPKPPKRRRRKTSFTKKLLLSCVTFFFMFCALELAIRGYFALASDSLASTQKHEKLLVLPESQRVYAYKPSLPAPLDTNSHGFRGEDVTLEKSPGTRRIVMIGDSVTAGNGVLSNETFAYHVQADINSRASADGIKVESLNLGVTGYNSRQELAMLKEVGFRFDPNVVVLNVCLNDSDPVKVVVQAGLKNTTAVSKWSDINIRTVVDSSYVLTFLKNTV